YQPREQLADALAAGDVHLVSLRPQLEGLIVPSKLYGVLAAGRPVVFVGDPHGEASRIIAEARIGMSGRETYAAGRGDALGTLRADARLREEAGARARQLFEQRYTLEIAVERWRALLATVNSDRSSALSRPALSP